MDPSAGAVQAFAYDLRKLRREAGDLTYRVMAARVHYSVTTLSQAAAGERMPSLAVTLAYVAACGGDAAEWERRWRATVEDAVAQAAADDGPDAPYLGLNRYEFADRERFFGRERLVAELVTLVRRRRFVAVFGPSGSGKSSLLRAGLLPALAPAPGGPRRPVSTRVITPGDRPARTHAALLTAREPGRETVVVVDQFEEVFTLCGDAAERTEFINLLLAARERGSGLRVVLGVRGDFYGRCADHDGLVRALRDANLLVGPMSPDEVRAAVGKPAAAAGLVVERALTARVVADVAAEPGGLPLMSHALLETWRRRRGRMLTLEAYETSGGVRGAVALTAERVYAELSPEQAALARWVLLRLVNPGDGAPDTRRPVDRAELDTGSPADVDRVLERLAQARLLTLDGSTVDIAHEALLSSWPRLRGWLDEDRDRLRVHRRLAAAAQTWRELGRDPGALYGGIQLATAEQQLHTAELNAAERDFLDASRAARELRERAATRNTRRLRALVAGLTVLLVLAAASGLVAWRQNETSRRQRIQAAALRLTAVADGRRFVDPASAMLLSVAAWRTTDTPETRSALLAALAQREQDAFAEPDPEPGAERFLTADGRTLVSVGAKAVLTWDVATHRRTATAPGLDADAWSVLTDVSPDGRTLALSTDRGIQFRDLASGRLSGVLPDATQDESGSFGPSGRIFLRDVTDPGTGRTGVQIWDLRQRRMLFHQPLESAGPEGTLHADAGADDRTVAFCSSGRPLEVWDVVRRKRLPALTASGVRQGCVQHARLTPDGRTLVVVVGAGVRVWDVASGRLRAVFAQPGIEEIAVSPDGAFVVTSDADDIRLWRTGESDRPVFRHPLAGEEPTQLRLDVAQRRIRYLDSFSGSVVRTLDVTGAVEPAWHAEPLEAAVFSPGGATLATMPRTGDHARWQLWDGRTGRRGRELPGDLCPADPAGPEPSPDLIPLAADSDEPRVGIGQGDSCLSLLTFDAAGRTAAYAAGPTPPELPVLFPVWDLAAGRAARTLRLAEPPDDPEQQTVNEANGIALSPDGATLLISHTPEGEVTEIWDVRRGVRTGTVPDVGGEALVIRPDGALLVTSHDQLVDLRSRRVEQRALGVGDTSVLAFSPDGRYLAAGDHLGRVTLWDGDVRRRLGVYPGTSADGTEAVSGLAFSPDGRTLAVAGSAGTLQLWDTSAHLRLGAPLPTPGDAQLAVAFSPDGEQLSAVGQHTGLRTYPVGSRAVAAEVCGRAGGTLSRAVWAAYLPEAPYRDVCPR
ncbi:hypothetical protein [Actinoplanes sp. NPDC049599]|uniref:nSTAND1 domain-containing NTPase n=1 Tax=Actinoplanes sp. NPDC049599 TaxID=3363903 RepID=UPI0037944033